MKMSSSDSETEADNHKFSRLGPCEVCGAREALYTCPKCEVKTCCLNCVRIHKKELECDGIRDRTKYIRVKDFTDNDLLSDYRLLEECTRFVYGIKRDEKKKFTRIDKDLPIHLYKLKMAARKRGIVLQLLTHNFTRRKVNTTRYNFKTNIIYWRIEWIFPNVENCPLKFVDDKCSETCKVSTLLDKYLNPDAPPIEGSKQLTYYKSVGCIGVKILMKAEKVKGSCKKFFELDPTETLADNLSGKCIVEFPIIFVVLKDHACNFDIVTSEQELDILREARNKENVKKEELRQGVHSDNINKTYGKPKLLLTEKIAQEKKMEIEKELKEAKKKRPKNLLFTTGYSSEESIEEDDII